MIWQFTVISFLVYNLFQISWGAGSPELSDKSKYPRFFRVTAPATRLNVARIELARLFNWKKLGIIHYGAEYFSSVISQGHNTFKLCFFALILYVQSTIFQLNRDGSSWVETVLSEGKYVLLKDHNAVTPARLEPAASRSRVKHSLRSLFQVIIYIVYIYISLEEVIRS